MSTSEEPPASKHGGDEFSEQVRGLGLGYLSRLSCARRSTFAPRSNVRTAPFKTRRNSIEATIRATPTSSKVAGSENGFIKLMP